MIILVLQWDEYYTEIERVAARVPYMVCDGNHETDWPGPSWVFIARIILDNAIVHSNYIHYILGLSSLVKILEESAMFLISLEVPCLEKNQALHGIHTLIVIQFIVNKGNTECFCFSRYGFDFGCIHFVMMSGEHDFTPKSKQYSFLVNHLKSVNRSSTPWLIFTGHRYNKLLIVVLTDFYKLL